MVEGKVTKVSEPRRIKGKATIGILPQTVVLPGGERYPLDATLVDTNLRDGSDVNEEGQFKGRAHDRNDLAELGAGVGGGMIAGGLIGGRSRSSDRRWSWRNRIQRALSRTSPVDNDSIRDRVDIGIEPSAD